MSKEGPEDDLQSKEGLQDVESTAERGRNVSITLNFIRHGLRTPDNVLTEHGREVTREKARTSGIHGEDYDLVKAQGSNADPRVLEEAERERGGMAKMGRSLETADIYSKEIAGDDAGLARARDVLNYHTYVTPEPFDYAKMHKSFLPENYDSLSPEEQTAAQKRAQIAVVKKLLNDMTPEAIAYRKEIAGSFAEYIHHMQGASKRLKSGYKAFVSVGTHGGLVEPFFKEALVRRMPDGSEICGFDDVSEIGGEINPSEAFHVAVTTSEDGFSKDLRVTWEPGSARPADAEMYLDIEKIEELAAYYRELHPIKKEE